MLLVCDWFMKDTANLAPALVEEGVDVQILCTDQHEAFLDAEERNRALAPVRKADIVMHEIPRYLGDGGSIGPCLRARRRIMRWRPDVAYVHSTADLRLYALTRSIPVILNVHDPVFHPGQPPGRVHHRIVRRRLLRSADVITVHGASLKEEIKPQLRARQHVEAIPLGIVPRTEPMPVPAAPTILFFGRLVAYKGLDVLADAMRTVWQQIPHVRLIVAGTGPLAGDIPADPLVVRRIEYIPESDIDGLFEQATLLVLPYTQASQSGPGGLALARGVPVVVTAVGALAELVPDPSYVVPPGDPQALAEAIKRHLGHEEQTRLRILEHARRTQSWGVAARTLLKTLRRYGILSTTPR